MAPAVSVIVPNYNHGPYLAQRIDSVLAQSCQDFELILLDDASTDDSRDVLERYRAHPKVATILLNDENSGTTFKQWDKGIAQARGEFVWIAESDDWCDSTMLEELLHGIRQSPDCVLSYCQTYVIGEHGRINWQSSHTRLAELMEGADFIRDYLPKVTIYNASMALWRKDRYASIPRDFMRYRFCGDWMFWIALSRTGKVHISGRVLNYFRQHPGNVSSQVYRSGLSLVEELQVLAWMFATGLIDERGYAAAFKTKYREYWPIRAAIDAEQRLRIEELLATPASPRISPALMRAGAMWQGLRSR